jgi:hypothetical protein
LGGVAKILHASLRGSDGTNMQYFDEEIRQSVANLSEDEAAAIDRMFDEPPRT